MVCVYCGSTTRTVNSRHQKRLNQVWRRRRCTECGAIFTTLEAVDTNLALGLRSGTHFEPFSRDKLLLSVHDSLKHRKTALEDALALTGTIMSRLYPHVQDASLSREILIKTALDVLTHFDKAAATHYQAFHPIK
jgi:transcriptional repressor NrdR